MTVTPIPIDLEVYKALEAKRISFNEPHNAILRRILGIGSASSLLPEASSERLRTSRASGDYELRVMGKTIKVRSLREALSTTLLTVEADQPGFLDRLTERRTTRGRRIVARSPADIYPNRPQLEQYAAPLTSEWLFDTNISRKACERYLVIVGLVANIETPRLL
jgi:hypothetical protein